MKITGRKRTALRGQVEMLNVLGKNCGVGLWDAILHNLITHHPQPNPGIAKRQEISVLEPSEGCLLYPSPLFQPEFQPAATCQGRVQRARSGGLQGLGKVRVAEDGA